MLRQHFLHHPGRGMKRTVGGGREGRGRGRGRGLVYD